MSEIRVHIELLEAEPEPGLWCEHCLLPSVVSFPFIELMDGVPTSAFVVRQCQDCEREWGWT